MGKFHTRKKGEAIIFKLKENMYTIAQRLEGQIVRFFDIVKKDMEFDNLDLNNISILFEVMVATTFVESKFAVGKPKNVKPNTRSYVHYWISPYTSMDDNYKGVNGSFPFLGGKLVDFSNEYFYEADAPIVKANLDVTNDRDLIEKYELTNMWGEAIIERLVRYFETGIDRDDLKFEVFPLLWDDKEKFRPLTSRLPLPLR
ncbi:hypothetical protein [Bergeriella denitrificans]|uniref:Uncharacterized protein n=1 Tax=Bergeriella denitrificans TaxID=494 RepID=A0A378UEI2_BERDE|nr:hypothetical protein [Bergeriella denitrificans]STZ75766.1 Uncharacterised protein [Bergeriella denitrificans]